ncbi:MAG: cell division protein FtsQ [Alphaproteobacteria bacterium HGW-Alphaproteobacteria-11]|nr:MAG: cell division protein FtsQ [Alphaproteobacteria bacterium HGW-Alphaproteobacteria-11]
MRSMKKASRTGVRAAPRRAAKSKIAPGKRRNAAQTRVFGRRSQRPPGPVGRWLAEIGAGEFPMRPFTAGAGALFAGVLLYGLFVGGHVADGANGISERANRLLAMSGFSIQDVTVTGRERTDKEALLAAAGMDRGDPIFGFDTEAARQRVERLGWVESATVTRLLPDTIRIDVTERQPFALWQRGGMLSVIDAEGRPITDEGVQEFAHLPFIVGFGAPREAPALLKLMQAEQPQLLQRVRAFVRVSGRRWNLRLENGVDVKLPESGVAKALADLVAHDARHRILSRDIVAVDLRLPDRVSVELAADAGSAQGIAAGAKSKNGIVRPGAAGIGGNT